MIHNKFRPMNLSKRYLLRERRLGNFNNYNWHSRIQWFPVGYKFNKLTIAKQFRRLHYLARHAPISVTIKWNHAVTLFQNKYFASKGKASMRYLNNWTCHSWL